MLHTHTHTHTQELVHAAHTLVRTPAALTSVVEARNEDRQGPGHRRIRRGALNEPASRRVMSAE